MKSILFIEDDPFITEVYSTRFHDEGFVVDIANDCEMGLKKILQKYPDVVVLDVNFGQGKMNGIELLEKLRSDPRTANLEVILLSNYNRQYIDEHYHVAPEALHHTTFFVKVETSVDEIATAVSGLLGEKP